MLIVKWAPIVETAWEPSFDPVLADHIGAYRNPKVRRASLSAWKLLYQALAENGLEAGEVAFENCGKPHFVGNPVYFSIAHSRGVCAAAVSDQPVGVDVERIRDSYNPHMVERSLSEREKERYDGDFTRIWCRKESLAKMTGRGIVGYPNGIDTTEYKFWEEIITCGGESYWLATCCGQAIGPDGQAGCSAVQLIGGALRPAGGISMEG